MTKVTCMMAIMPGDVMAKNEAEWADDVKRLLRSEMTLARRDI